VRSVHDAIVKVINKHILRFGIPERKDCRTGAVFLSVYYKLSVDATLRAVLRHACESSYNVPGERFLRIFLTLDNASVFSSSDSWLELFLHL